MTILIIWYPVLFCLYLSSPILLRKLIVLKTYLWMLPFIWNMSRLYRLIVAWEIKQKLHKILMLRFFWDTLYILWTLHYAHCTMHNALFTLYYSDAKMKMCCKLHNLRIGWLTSKQTNRQTNKVTSSLLELLVAAKKKQKKIWDGKTWCIITTIEWVSE